jgi:hypothetical protein
MSQGKRGRWMRTRRPSNSNFESSRLDDRGEYGRTGRYRPSGQQNSPGVKSGKPFITIPVHLRNA